MTFSVDQACDICCLLDPCEATEVSSGTHEYESVSFSGFIVHWFSGWFVVHCAEHLSWLFLLCPPYKGTKEKLFGGNNFVSLKSFSMRKMIVKEGLMREFELTITEGSNYFS